MEDDTDYLASGMGWAVGGSVWCTAGWLANLLELLVQVFPEPGRGTIHASVSIQMGAIKFVTNLVNISLASRC